MTVVATPLTERFWSNVVVVENGCWHWTGTRNQQGYGVITGPPIPGKRAGRLLKAHRVSYELFGGQLSDLHLDHVCHGADSECVGGKSCLHRRCVNPAHLEPVTPKTNAQRSYPARKTTCVNGHERTPDNARIRRGTDKRYCHICSITASRVNSRRRRREAKERLSEQRGVA